MKLLCFLIVFGTFASNSLAQAIDPDCWYPKVGSGIDVDDHDMSVDPDFGGSLVRLQNPSDNTYYLACTGYRGNTNNHTVFHSNSPLDIHNLSLFRKLNINLYKAKFGHFRDTKHLDVLGDAEVRTYGCPIIYWADDEGMYDSNRYTILWSSVQGDYGPEVGAGFNFSPERIIGHITNDSTDDILFLGATNWILHNPDSSKTYAILFQGGQRLLNVAGHVIQDSICYFPKLGLLFGTQDDFTGDGRVDWIVSDTKGNMLVYKSAITFSMQGFIDQIKNDTLIAAWQNPRLVDNNYLWGLTDRFTIAGLPRKPGDKSVDFAPSLFTVDFPSHSFWFFRGGPEFGTHRLTLDSAEIIITNPAGIDATFNGLDAGIGGVDAGDLTGTGRPVMKTGGSFGHDQSFEFYYVLGDAIDDKIDIIISHPHGTGSGAIPIDADGDKYGDIVYQAHSEYDGLDPQKSGLWVLHGSDKIPVHINPKYAAVSNPTVETEGSPFPNPVISTTTIPFSIDQRGPISLEVTDALGRNIATLVNGNYEAGTYTASFDMNGLSAGVCYVRLKAGGKESVRLIVKQ